MKATRWLGVLGAIILIAYLLAHSAEDVVSVRNSPYSVVHMIGAAAWTLIVLGMLGMAETVHQHTGRLG